ncbi:hypothetical protein [Brucella melitensis]|uniref:hypothetical protein n=1 Tax=Brucella melitensis TaxID=29459 RepID=UPI0012BCEE0C|nr:hypothetical protein [Brucella melitensis]
MQPKIDRKSKRILQVVILAIPTNARPNAAEPQNPIARLIHFYEIIIKYKIRALEPQAPAAASRSNILTEELTVKCSRRLIVKVKESYRL